jgi:hypothetical protein
MEANEFGLMSGIAEVRRVCTRVWVMMSMIQEPHGTALV